MAGTAKVDLSANGSDSWLWRRWIAISNFKSTKKDHILEEKVLHFIGHDVSQHEISTKKSEQSIANEPTLSKVVKEDFFPSSKVLDEGEEGLDKSLTNEIDSKDVSRRILKDKLLEHSVTQNLLSTAFQALKFQGRTKPFVGPRSAQRDDGILLKTGKIKIAWLTTQNFHSAEGKQSTELERIDKLLLLRSELGNKDTKSQRNRSEISELSWSLPLPARNKKKGCETDKNDKAAQQNMATNNKKLKMIVNNLAKAVSYSFRNALALRDQKNHVIDKSFLTFLLRREVRKMCLIKELIEELKAITTCSRFKFHEDDFKDISETVQSLHSLMQEDLKHLFSEEIPHENRKCFPVFTAVFAIIGRIIAVLGLAVVFLGKWSGPLVFILLALVLFLVITPFVK